MYDPWTELKWWGRGYRWEGEAGQRGIKVRKWDNCSSIINKMYLKKLN